MKSILLFVIAFLFAACDSLRFGRAGVAPAVLAAQTPGIASGAGATITGPSNSAAPTTQIAERTTTYFPPAPAPAEPPAVSDSPLQPSVPRAPKAAAPPIAPAVQSITEKTSTTIGQHQSASGIVKAAAELESLNKVQWFGIVCIIAGTLMIIWSLDHDKGYPLVYVKTVGCGIALLFVTNPWWLLLLLLPLGLYAAQKFGLLKIPLP